MFLFVQQQHRRVFISFKKIFCILGISLFFFGGCNIYAEEKCDYEDFVHEIINDFKKKAEKELGLICIGRGGRMPDGKVEEIEVGFVTYRKGTVEEARRLEVQATEMLLKKINNHNKIRPFLKVYPFTSDRAEVSISFNKPDNTAYKDGSVTYAFQVKNKIFYKSEDGVSPTYKTIAEEPYEDARRIVLGYGDDHFLGATYQKAIKDEIAKVQEKYGFYTGEEK